MSSARVKQIKGDTSGSILFIGAGGQGSEDNSNLFWDISNLRLGVATSVPTAQLHVDGSFRLSNLTTTPAAGYVLQSTDALGNVDWALAGADTNFANTNLTLTGPRTHNTNGNLLTISSDGGFAESSFNMTSSVIQLGNGGSYVNYSASGILMRVNAELRISVQTAATVINDQSGDYDFQVKGDTDSSLLYVNGGTNRVGIGTSNPTEKLHVVGNIYNTGGIAQQNNTSSGFISKPGGGQYQTTTNAHTGAIEIKLPTGIGGDMFSFWVDIYDYAIGQSLSVFIGGYVQGVAGNWGNATAIVYTKDATKDLTVRFGNDGVNNIVWIGELASTWNYPQVTVRDFQGGFATNISQWIDGWSIAFEAASFDTINQTQSGNLPIAGGDGNGIYDGSGTAPATTTVTLDGYLNFDTSNLLYLDGTNNRIGIGTSNPTQAKVQFSMTGSEAPYGIYGTMTGATTHSTSAGIRIHNFKTGGATGNYGIFGVAKGNTAAGGRNIGVAGLGGSEGFTWPNGTVGVFGSVASAINPTGVTSWAGKFNNQSTTSPIKYGIEVDVTGTNAGSTSYGIDINHSNIGTTGYGINVAATGANTTNYGIYISASGGTTNKAIFVANGETDLAGAFATRQVNGVNLTANTNNLVIPETAFLRMTTNNVWNLTGMAGGRDGRRITCINLSGSTITFTHQDAASTAANRFLFADSTNRVVVQNGALEFIYDSTTQRWRHIGGTV